MEKLRFIADTDWQSNVDGRPSISLQIYGAQNETYIED